MSIIMRTAIMEMTRSRRLRMLRRARIKRTDIAAAMPAVIELTEVERAAQEPSQDAAVEALFIEKPKPKQFMRHLLRKMRIS